MAFTPRWAPSAEATFLELQSTAQAAMHTRARNNKSKPGKAEGLYKQLDKCVRLLLDNPRHPGLRTHEFHSLDHPHEPGGKVFEAYVQNRTPGAYRLFWCYGPGKNEITIVAITPRP